MKRQKTMKPSSALSPKVLTVNDVRGILALSDDQSHKERIERAEQTLEDLKALFTHAPLLQNGSLTTGSIEYAAFRMQTLSLIFEFAKDALRRASNGADSTYDEFLRELGDEVGITFARDIMTRLIDHNLLLPFQDMRKILDLLASFENDTGAGETRIAQYTTSKIVVELRNNPLRKAESSSHAHCGFYKSYISALVNEIYNMRAKYIKDNVQGSTMKAQTVVRVTEEPSSDDECAFVIECRPQGLTRAFECLIDAHDKFFSLNAADDFVICYTSARGALVNAQMEVLGIEEDRPPRNMHLVYKQPLGGPLYRKMDEAYQRASKGLHPESKTRSRVNRSEAWRLLRDVRRCVYALEVLELDEGQKSELKSQIAKSARLSEIEELAIKTKDLQAEEKKQLAEMIGELKAGTRLSEARLEKLAGLLKQAGGKLWEISKPVVSELLSSALKKQLGLE